MSANTINVLMSYVIYKERHNGTPPTYREVASMVGVRSTSVVHWHVKRLVKSGKLIEVRPGTYDLSPLLGEYKVDWGRVRASVRGLK